MLRSATSPGLVQRLPISPLANLDASELAARRAALDAPLPAASASDPLGLVHAVLDENYRVEAVEATGGSSIVYRAVHVISGCPVAIKAFHPPDEVSADHRAYLFKAFVREGRLAVEL